MARLTMTLTGEMDEIREAVALLVEIHASLAKRHGDSFRNLDRMIERFIENPRNGVRAHWIGGGIIVAAPTGDLTDIFREARRLGVIR